MPTKSDAVKGPAMPRLFLKVCFPSTVNRVETSCGQVLLFAQLTWCNVRLILAIGRSSGIILSSVGGGMDLAISTVYVSILKTNFIKLYRCLAFFLRHSQKCFQMWGNNFRWWFPWCLAFVSCGSCASATPALEFLLLLAFQFLELANLRAAETFFQQASVASDAIAAFGNGENWNMVPALGYSCRRFK